MDVAAIGDLLGNLVARVAGQHRPDRPHEVERLEPAFLSLHQKLLPGCRFVLLLFHGIEGRDRRRRTRLGLIGRREGLGVFSWRVALPGQEHADEVHKRR